MSFTRAGPRRKGCGSPTRGSRPIAAAADDPRPAIRAEALALGFDAVGFAPTEPIAGQAERLSRYLAEGRQGEMGWMAANVERRASIGGLWPEARAVIVVGIDYGPARDPLERLGWRDRGAISVYAQGRDYHDVVKPRLKALARFVIGRFGGDAKVFVDTAPVMEKPLATLAGLGWQGKHTNLVSRGHGSWLLLGEVFTTLPLAPDEPHADRCGGCQRCQDACPTAAFPAPYQLDARRCLSYLTIEHKGAIPLEFRRPMGNRIYGCDDCLAVCPWNKFARTARESAFHPRAELQAPKLAELAMLDDAGFREIFSGSPIKRIGRDRFVRNVVVALGNSGNPAVVPLLRRLTEDASPLVRAMACWALAELLPSDEFHAFAATRLLVEPDVEVRRELAPCDATQPGPAGTGISARSFNDQAM